MSLLLRKKLNLCAKIAIVTDKCCELTARAVIAFISLLIRNTLSQRENNRCYDFY